MRAFLVMVLGLVAWPTFAATPTVEAFRGTNEVLVISNVLDNRIIIGPATRISVTASNAAQTIANAASNALFSIFAANNLITSNGAISFTLTTSNSLVSQYLNADITTSNGAISFAMTVSNAVASLAGESNYNGEISVTNVSRFGWVNGKSGITNLLRSFQPAYGLKGTNESGTNISLAIDPAIVVQQSDLTSASNALVSLLIANDTLTSNGAVSFTLTTSNSLRTSFLSSDITTSNGAVAFSMTVSNAMAALVGETNWNGEVSVTNSARFGWVNGKANNTNLLRSFQPAYGLKGTNESGTNISLAIDPAIVASQSELTTASNTLRTAFVANDTTTSNGLVTLLVANDTTTSNALRTDIGNLQGATNGLDTRVGNLEGSSNLTAYALVSSTTFLTNWANSISNYVTAATNSASVTNWINARQTASGNLTNWSNIPTGAMANVVSANFLTNWANSVSNYVTASTNSASVTNWINSCQPANATLTNLASNPYVAYTNILTKTATTVSGAGNGNTNYLISISTNSVNYFYFGSSNVNIYTVSGSTLGSPILWTAIVTNLSAINWGFGTSSGTNRWKWYHPAYGTNRPAVLTNNTALCLQGQSDGTNTLVSYFYFAPGL